MLLPLLLTLFLALLLALSRCLFQTWLVSLLSGRGRRRVVDLLTWALHLSASSLAGSRRDAGPV
jgi:hypothetical protein